MEWTDGLPLSQSPPFRYTFTEAASTQRARFQSYLSDRKWSDTELTAASSYPLMSAALLERYHLETCPPGPGCGQRSRCDTAGPPGCPPPRHGRRRR